MKKYEKLSKYDKLIRYGKIFDFLSKSVLTILMKLGQNEELMNSETLVKPLKRNVKSEI